MSYFELDAKQFEEVTQAIQKVADGREAERTINEYLAGEGGDLIKEGIHELLPVSGRKWKRKRTAAKSTDPFQKQGDNLSVRVSTKGGYHYLYFPDDGSTTEKHFGDKQFMFKGAQNKSEDLVNEIIEKLLEKMEG